MNTKVNKLKLNVFRYFVLYTLGLCCVFRPKKWRQTLLCHSICSYGTYHMWARQLLHVVVFVPLSYVFIRSTTQFDCCALAFIVCQEPATEHIIAAPGSPVDALHQLEPLRLAKVRPSREEPLPSSRQLPQPWRTPTVIPQTQPLLERRRGTYRLQQVSRSRGGSSGAPTAPPASTIATATATGIVAGTTASAIAGAAGCCALSIRSNLLILSCTPSSSPPPSSLSSSPSSCPPSPPSSSSSCCSSFRSRSSFLPSLVIAYS